jgi:hypothetical protein
LGAPVTVTAPANKGYVWDMTGGNYGTATGTSVPHGGASSPYYVPHYEFDWPSLPDGYNIISATLYVYWSGGLPAYTDGGGVIDYIDPYDITSSWSEGGSKPTLGSSLGTLPMVSNASWGSIRIDSYVQARYAGTTKYGVAWGMNDYRDSSVYHHGRDQANKPYVEIQYYVPSKFMMMV